MNVDLISRKALLEAVRLKGHAFMSRVVFEQLIANAPAVEQGEPAAEVSHVDVLPDSNGMYEHRFLFPDRLAVQTELYMYNPNKHLYSDKSSQPREWVGLSEQEMFKVQYDLQYSANGFTPMEFAKVVEAKLRELNTKG